VGTFRSMTGENIVVNRVLGSDVAYIEIYNTEGHAVDARLLVEEIAEVTGINFQEVSPAARALTDEDCAILELHRLAKSLGGYFADTAPPYRDYVFNGTRLPFAGVSAPTAVELLAKVRAAMTPKRTVAEIKEELLTTYRRRFQLSDTNVAAVVLTDSIDKLETELAGADA
jgi:hypothetical protein